MLAAVASAKALWYLTRGTGMVTLLLLTASVTLGIVEVNRWSNPRWPRFVTAALHGNISLLSCAFLTAHIVTSVVDGFAPIRWLDAVVPFTSPYRPLWLGLGAVATDLLVALIITSLLRARLGVRAWRAVHWAAYACWPVAVLHGLGTGSDSARGWALAVYATCVALVVTSVWWRLVRGWSRERVARLAVAGAGSVLFPVAVVGFVVLGPLRTGWALRAGTPRSLIASTRAAPSVPRTTAGAVGTTGFGATWSDQLSGSLSQTPSDDGGQTTVTIDATLAGSAPGSLHITLSGPPAAGGGVVLASSAATLGPPGQPDRYRGTVSGLDGSRVELTFLGPSGERLRATADLQVDGATVTGTLGSGR